MSNKIPSTIESQYILSSNIIKIKGRITEYCFYNSMEEDRYTRKIINDTFGPNIADGLMQFIDIVRTSHLNKESYERLLIVIFRMYEDLNLLIENDNNPFAAFYINMCFSILQNHPRLHFFGELISDKTLKDFEQGKIDTSTASVILANSNNDILFFRGIRYNDYSEFLIKNVGIRFIDLVSNIVNIKNEFPLSVNQYVANGGTVEGYEKKRPVVKSLYEVMSESAIHAHRWIATDILAKMPSLAFEMESENCALDYIADTKTLDLKSFNKLSEYIKEKVTSGLCIYRNNHVKLSKFELHRIQSIVACLSKLGLTKDEIKLSFFNTDSKGLCHFDTLVYAGLTHPYNYELSDSISFLVKALNINETNQVNMESLPDLSRLSGIQACLSMMLIGITFKDSSRIIKEISESTKSTKLKNLFQNTYLISQLSRSELVYDLCISDFGRFMLVENCGLKNEHQLSLFVKNKTADVSSYAVTLLNDLIKAACVEPANTNMRPIKTAIVSGFESFFGKEKAISISKIFDIIEVIDLGKVRNYIDFNHNQSFNLNNIKSVAMNCAISLFSDTDNDPTQAFIEGSYPGNYKYFGNSYELLDCCESGIKMNMLAFEKSLTKASAEKISETLDVFRKRCMDFIKGSHDSKTIRDIINLHSHLSSDSIRKTSDADFIFDSCCIEQENVKQTVFKRIFKTARAVYRFDKTLSGDPY